MKRTRVHKRRARNTTRRRARNNTRRRNTWGGSLDRIGFDATAAGYKQVPGTGILTPYNVPGAKSTHNSDVSIKKAIQDYNRAKPSIPLSKPSIPLSKEE